MTLNEEQQAAVKTAIGDGSDWPKLTTDPVVNWAVDCKVLEEDLPYDAAVYEAEAIEFARRFS